jgi:hypothetical protein
MIITFDPYSRVKEILVKKEKDILPVLYYLDPNEEIKVTYLHNEYKISFPSEIMLVEDVQKEIPEAVILSVW